MVSRHDLEDGIRAMMVDKDMWESGLSGNLQSCLSVNAAAVNAIVTPLPKYLQLAWKQRLI